MNISFNSFLQQEAVVLLLIALFSSQVKTVKKYIDEEDDNLEEYKTEEKEKQAFLSQPLSSRKRRTDSPKVFIIFMPIYIYNGYTIL